MNGGKDFCQWSKKDKELASSIGKLVEFVLGKYGKGLVSIALAESFLEKGLDNYEVVSLAEKGRMQAEAGGKTEQVFVAVSILVWLSFIHGNGEDAREILESFQIQAAEFFIFIRRIFQPSLHLVNFSLIKKNPAPESGNIR